MANSVIVHWQQWESRLQGWLNQSEPELDLKDTTPFDRMMLTVLTVKYQLSYVNEHKLNRKKRHRKREKSGESKDEAIQSTGTTEQEYQNLSTVKLSKITSVKKENTLSQIGARCELFLELTGCFLRPAEASKDTSPQW